MSIDEYLMPVLNPAHTVILDNATFHKSEKTRQLTENTEFLSPYSPDLNPIETFRVNLKKKFAPYSDPFNGPLIMLSIPSLFNLFNDKLDE